ncbi:hypothetical protein AB5N19_05251 [Seiridium cardinale]
MLASLHEPRHSQASTRRRTLQDSEEDNTSASRKHHASNKHKQCSSVCLSKDNPPDITSDSRGSPESSIRADSHKQPWLDHVFEDDLSDESFEPPALSHEIAFGADGGHEGHASGYPLSRLHSEGRASCSSLSAVIEEIKNRPERQRVEMRGEMELKREEEERTFRRLPLSLQQHLEYLAAEGPRYTGRARERTLCGKGMSVYPESGKVDWKPIDWDPPPKKVIIHFMQGDLVIEDHTQAKDWHITAPEVDSEPATCSAVDELLTNTRPGIEGGDVMEVLAPVNSRSVPVYLRERAARGRKNRQRSMVGSITRAIRGWIETRKSSDSSDDTKDTKDTKAAWLKEFLGRPWKDRGSHDSGICIDNSDERDFNRDRIGTGDERDFNWDRIGPKDEHLVYSSDIQPLEHYREGHT